MSVLGIRDTKQYGDSDFRFENWRRTILYTFPNGAAPLTALLSLLRSEETNDPHFHWYEKSLPTQRSAVSSNYTDVATSVIITDNICRPGHIIENETTGEQMLVTAVTGSGPYTLTVTRGEWAVSAAAGTAGQYIRIVGNVTGEGGDVPTAFSVDPTPKENYCQIFRSAMHVTGTAMKTSLKFDKSGPTVELLRQALEFQSIEMEKNFIWGMKAEFLNASNEVVRTTDGIIRYIPTANVVDVDVDGGGNLSQTLMNHYIERAFRVCSNKQNEKLALCGSGALGVLNNIAQQGSSLNIVPGAESFGMDLTKWITPHGTLYLKTHPLFTQHPTYRNWILILDVHNLVYRYVTGRDLTRLTNRQNPGKDARIDEFLAECGLEVHHGDTHFLIKNVACFDTDIYCPADGV